MTPPGAVGRDRPKGYFPRGTSLGVVGLIALAAAVPLDVLIAVAPLTTGGDDRLVASLPYLLAFGVLPGFVMVLGARSHKYWLICFFFYAGAALLLAYAVAAMIALAGAAGAFPVRDPSLHAMSFVGIVLLAVLSPFAWFLLRALRLRYWQPGSPRDTWEVGNETPSGVGRFPPAAGSVA